MHNANMFIDHFFGGTVCRFLRVASYFLPLKKPNREDCEIEFECGFSNKIK